MGQEVDGLRDPLLSFPGHPGAGRSPTPGPPPGGNFCRGSRKEDSWGEPGEATRSVWKWLFCLSATPRASAPGEGGTRAGSRFFSLHSGPGAAAQLLTPAKGLWRPLQLAAASPPGAGLSRGIPRGALHLHGDRVGRAAPRLPRLGPVSQGPLEDHPEGLPQPL